MSAHPHPLTGVFYCIQFDRDPLRSVDRIVDVLIPNGMLGRRTAPEFLRAIDDTLASGESLTRLDMSEFGLSEEHLRRFLVALRLRLAGPHSVPTPDEH